MKGRDIGHAVLVRVLGFIIFLVLIGILNLLSYYIQNAVLQAIVTFLNTNLLLIIVFTIIFIIADIFYYLWFPLDLPAPLLSAFAAILLVKFIFNLIKFVFSLIGLSITLPVTSEFIYIIVAIIVFIIVVIVGYARLFGRAMRRRREHHGRQESYEDDDEPVKVKRTHRRSREE